MNAQPLRKPVDAQPGPELDVIAALRDIAIPRMSGSEGNVETGDRIRRMFEELGYDIEEREFRFSPLARRFGITAAAAVYIAGTIAATLVLYRGEAVQALLLLFTLLFVIGIGAFIARPLLDLLPFSCKRGFNMFAVANGGDPKYIIVAHRDSKSQPIPLALRGPAIVFAVLSWIVLVCTALVLIVQPVSGAFILVTGIVAAVAGFILIFGWIANRSPGALDNGSGVAAALGIAARERNAGDVAFLITDAEELGLIGARVAAKHLPTVHGAINLDGLDDEGAFYVMERFGIVRRRGLAPHLAAALLQEAEQLDEEIERRDLPFGVIVDHIPIAKAGTPALTIMRGTWTSLWRVHRGSDDLDNLHGHGIHKTVDLVSGALVRLREQARLLAH